MSMDSDIARYRAEKRKRVVRLEAAREAFYAPLREQLARELWDATKGGRPRRVESSGVPRCACGAARTARAKACWPCTVKRRRRIKTASKQRARAARRAA